MSSQDPFAKIVDRYFRCKKLLKVAEERLFELQMPMEELMDHETVFIRFKKEMKQLNFANIYQKDNTNFKQQVNEIYEYLEEYFLNNFTEGKKILQGGSDEEPTVSSQKGLKDILNNITNLSKEIGRSMLT